MAKVNTWLHDNTTEARAIRKESARAWVAYMKSTLELRGLTIEELIPDQNKLLKVIRHEKK